MKQNEWKIYAGLAVLCALPALGCLTWSPLRFGAFFLGALAVGCAGEAYTLRKAGRCPVCRALSRVGRVLFLLFLASFAAIEGMIAAGARPDNAAYETDYLLVLGARVYDDRPSAALASRLDAALDFLERYPGTVVLCGGRGSDERQPESHVMYDYMVARGADPARLLVEDQSHNTIENIDNAKAMLPAGARTAVLTSGYHLARARRLMARAGLDPAGLPAPTPYLSLRAVCCLREYCSTLGLIVTGRYF